MNKQLGINEAGFTLIEVLVAFVIIASVFAVVLELLSSGLLLGARSNDQRLAVLVAKSTLDRVGADIPLQAGESSGQTQTGLPWTVSIAPYQESGLPESVAHPYKVTVVVGRSQRAVRLTTLRLSGSELRP